MRRAIAIALLHGVLAAGCSESYVIAYTPEEGESPEAGEGGPRCDEACFPALPPIDDVQVTIRGSTAIVEFAGVPDAVDYRIFAMPARGAVGRDAEGRQTVRDAIYRCAGRRTVADRADQYGALFEESLLGPDGIYTRSELESLLGYVYLTPGPGRVAVYRVADPNGNGGYANADWIPPLYEEANSAEYVIDLDARADLLRRGFRDDGIAFYAPEDGDLGVYRVEYAPGASDGARVSFFFTDGPEHAARSSGDQSRVLDFGERFRVLSSAARGSVPLQRVTYHSGSVFDVLAAGPAAYRRALHQGGPVTALTWSGLRERGVLVIEALDAGCPFPGAYVGAFDAEAKSADGSPTRTLEALRSSETGEVFVNGQHDPDSRPAPIARAFVEVAPQDRPAMAFEADFDDGGDFAELTTESDTNATVLRNARWSIEGNYCGQSFTFGSVLGQLFLGLPQCRLHLVPREVSPRLERASFLHVRMATDLPSTGRRYPQILITTARSAETADSAAQLTLYSKLGPTAASEMPGSESSIVVQTFFSYTEPQIQLCERRGWGPTAFCPRANLYGYDAGEPVDRWTGEPWRPVPVLTDRVGFDRPVQLDVYASTERVYLFVDDQPTGCALLPAGAMPAGDVTVAFGAIVDEPEKDEVILGEPGRAYELERSPLHGDRRWDDLGIDVGVGEPTWDEAVLPCADRFYGGSVTQ